MGKRELAIGEDPDRQYPVPGQELIDGDYAEAADLRHIGQALENAGAIKLPEGTTVAYLWKAKGGKSAGRECWGKCVKLSGLTAYFGQDKDFVVWLAADYCYEAALSWLQIEALVFHELSHIIEETDKEGDPTGKPILTGHDFEGFKGEIERYGLYLPDAKYIAPAFQMALELG